MPMMISLFDWFWIGFIVTTTSGAIAYCLVSARKEVQAELEQLRSDLEHQRSRKKFWKAKAKGHKPESTSAERAQPISISSRRLSLGSSAAGS